MTVAAVNETTSSATTLSNDTDTKQLGQ